MIQGNTLHVAIPEAIRTKNFLGNIGGNALNGALGPMRFYTDDLDPREVASNFQNQADRFRSTPVGDIVKDGLIFHMDPANADGMKFPELLRVTVATLLFLKISPQRRCRLIWVPWITVVLVGKAGKEQERAAILTVFIFQENDSNDRITVPTNDKQTSAFYNTYAFGLSPTVTGVSMELPSVIDALSC